MKTGYGQSLMSEINSVLDHRLSSKDLADLVANESIAGPNGAMLIIGPITRYNSFMETYEYDLNMIRARIGQLIPSKSQTSSSTAEELRKMILSIYDWVRDPEGLKLSNDVLSQEFYTSDSWMNYAEKLKTVEDSYHSDVYAKLEPLLDSIHRSLSSDSLTQEAFDRSYEDILSYNEGVRTFNALIDELREARKNVGLFGIEAIRSQVIQPIYNWDEDPENRKKIPVGLSQALYTRYQDCLRTADNSRDWLKDLLKRIDKETDEVELIDLVKKEQEYAKSFNNSIEIMRALYEWT